MPRLPSSLQTIGGSSGCLPTSFTTHCIATNMEREGEDLHRRCSIKSCLFSPFCPLTSLPHEHSLLLPHSLSFMRSRVDRHLQPCVAVACLRLKMSAIAVRFHRVYTLKGAEWSKSRARATPKPIGSRANGRSRPSVRPSIDGTPAAVANDEMSQQISIIT